jgi:CDP-glucose 4,6-dehydratase
MIDLWGADARYELDAQPQVHEANYLKLDNSKARNLLAWTPQLDLAQALRWLTDWYQAYRRRDDMRALTLAQIQAFQDLGAGRAAGPRINESGQ